MRLLSSMIVCLALAGCALWPSKFDTQEHARIINIYVASKDNSACTSPEQARPLANQMYRDAEWLYHYGSTLTDNEDMTKMELSLLGMIRELRDRYNREDKVSVLYCRSKFDNIHRATETMIKVSARRPRT